MLWNKCIGCTYFVFPFAWWIQYYSLYFVQCNAVDTELIVKIIVDCMIDSNENIDENLLASSRNRNLVLISYIVREVYFDDVLINIEL